MKRNVSVVRLIVATRSSGPPAGMFGSEWEKNCTIVYGKFTAVSGLCIFDMSLLHDLCINIYIYLMLFRNSIVFWLHIALILIIHFTLRHGLSNMASDEYINSYYFHAPSFLLSPYFFFLHLLLKIV